MYKNIIFLFLFIAKRTKLVGEIVTWEKSQYRQETA